MLFFADEIFMGSVFMGHKFNGNLYHNICGGNFYTEVLLLHLIFFNITLRLGGNLHITLRQIVF